MAQLKIFNTSEFDIPQLATHASACFDIQAFLPENSEVAAYKYGDSHVTKFLVNTHRELHIYPWDRVLIPTGLIFDVPAGYHVQMHPRSGMSWNRGLVLANQTGILDEDYVKPIFVMLWNLSGVMQVVTDGDRIAQARLVLTEDYDMIESALIPAQKTNRDGGFGSTGK